MLADHEWAAMEPMLPNRHFAAQVIQHNADLLFGLILLPRRPADVADKPLGRHGDGIGFLSHLRSLAPTMSQKSAVLQGAGFVSQALKRDTQIIQGQDRRRHTPLEQMKWGKIQMAHDTAEVQARVPKSIS